MVKNIITKIKSWCASHRRRVIQLYAALLTNANIKGFVSGRIYRGVTKNMCVPGLNCYSCPGAVGACPLGSLQNALAASGTKTPVFVIGILMLLGLMLARTVCGFLCPVGLAQELAYKIKSPKLKKSRVTRVLSYFKYVLLALTIAIPLIYHSTPFFCKYICPAGTLEGGVGLLSNPNNSDFFAMLNYLFTWKFALLVVFFVASIFIFRFFCRFFCPLGAIYGFFNKFALIGVKVDKNKCTDCGKCSAVCKMDVLIAGDHECINCGQCITECPVKAISWKGSKLVLYPSEVDALVPLESGPSPINLSSGGAPVASLEKSTETVEISKQIFDETEENTTAVMEKSRAEKLKKRRKVLKIIAHALLAAVLVFALVYCNFIDKDPNIESNTVGGQIDEFTLPYLFDTAAAEEQFSVADCRGYVTVINFWQTTCDPCVAEIPHFEKVYDDYRDSVKMVAVHSVEVTENVQKFIDAKGWNEYDMMFAWDDEAVNAFEKLGGKAAFPVTVVVDKDGIITCIRQGAMSEQELRDEIEKAL